MSGTNCKSGLLGFMGWMASVVPPRATLAPSRPIRPRVYIAGPISKGDLSQNINQATQAMRELIKRGYAPLCPHLTVYAKPATTYHYFGGDQETWCKATIEGAPGITHQDWLDVDLRWVEVSDAILRLPGESKGADIEVAEAHRLGIPVFESIEDLEFQMKPG
jgi:hypothetical protein